MSKIEWNAETPDSAVDNESQEVVGEEILSTKHFEIDVYEYSSKSGIRPSKEFEKKGLASFSVNPAWRCGHDCLYCSTPSSLRTHQCFKELGLRPFSNGYAIIDPGVVAQVSKDARRKRKRGLVQLCTTVDAWAPETLPFKLGRRCLEAILGEPGWRVRVLTKNASVTRDFDVLKKHRERVLLGISTTTTPKLERFSSVIEPFASPPLERFEAMAEAHRLGIPTYGMLCPFLPGKMSEYHMLEQMFDLVLRNNPVEIFAEPVNCRGRALIKTAQALRMAGFEADANAVDAIRNRAVWREYAVSLVEKILDIAERKYSTDKMRILLYASAFDETSRRQIGNPKGVVWLDKKSAAKTSASGEKVE